MNEQKRVFWETIDILCNAGALPYILVIGSWAEYLYESYFENFTSNLRTMDVDFLIKNKNRPSEPINIPQIMDKHGFVQNIDGWGVMRYSKNAVLEIEFLIQELGSGKNEPYEVRSFNLTVEGLRHMDILIKNETQIEIKGLKIHIPKPAAYALHKMVIHNKRKEKKEKDRIGITNILDFIKCNELEYKTLKRIYKDELSKNERKNVDEFIKCNFIDIEFESN